MTKPRTCGSAFLVELVDAVIADQRIGHRDDLTAIRRIGQHLLITGHRGVETNFADLRALRAKGFAFENATVFESENCAHLAREDARLRGGREKKGGKRKTPSAHPGKITLKVKSKFRSGFIRGGIMSSRGGEGAFPSLDLRCNVLW